MGNKAWNDRLDTYDPESDPLYEQAKQTLRELGKVSTSLIQRHVGTGYTRSAAMIKAMEREGFCTLPDPLGRRKLVEQK